MNAMSREWAFSMAFSLFLMLVFGMGLVWLNIERVDMAYEITRLQGEIDQAAALTAKLEVERDTLITPGRLRELAVQFGLGPARSGQVRWMTESGETAGETKAATLATAGPGGQESAAPAAGKPRKADKAAKAPAKAQKIGELPEAPYEN
ncbi:hypothetical protein [Desulfolutivibrio sulfoxidireducens]|uniref:hypothetical protein n=1 Tax=Desulfolutivibrio sulfoxidireducens TaxID=2773299 RepID=UPI00159DA8BB|nr:hypothetical protein [Desulfolutivibrio sulfoxidireducens]QLA17204.1 hypothetical protein GD605_14460 [Desulfolutivibrio sulfoxidireducens]QLA20773.1 hypothetical protein GD604_14150 [Desulfolutivibrio sulfoxidireducens]